MISEHDFKVRVPFPPYGHTSNDNYWVFTLVSEHVSKIIMILFQGIFNVFLMQQLSEHHKCSKCLKVYAKYHGFSFSTLANYSKADKSNKCK